MREKINGSRFTIHASIHLVKIIPTLSYIYVKGTGLKVKKKEPGKCFSVFDGIQLHAQVIVLPTCGLKAVFEHAVHIEIIEDQGILLAFGHAQDAADVLLDPAGEFDRCGQEDRGELLEVESLTDELGRCHQDLGLVAVDPQQSWHVP